MKQSVLQELISELEKIPGGMRTTAKEYMKGYHLQLNAFEKAENMDNDFQECDECDGHDACHDFGCAIKHGLDDMVQTPL